MRVFVDTNILIDVLAQRNGFLEAAQVLAYTNKQGYSLHVSTLTMANVAYIMRKTLRGDMLYGELNKISSIVNVESLTRENYDSALQLKAKDFEDALQYFCAKECQCDVIVTRNMDDFSFSKIEIVTPEEFLKKWQIR